MDLIQAFKYPLSDPQWLKKMLVAAVLSFGSLITLVGNFMSESHPSESLIVRIVGGLLQLLSSPFLAGYLLRASRNAARGELLPEWDDWGSLFFDGLRVIGLWLGYFLPVILLYSLFVFALAVAFGGIAMGGHGLSSGASAALAVGGMGLYLGGLLFFLLLCVAVGFLVVPAFVLLMRDGASLGQSFQLGTVWNISKSNFMNILLFGVYCFLLGIFSSIVSVCTCGLGQIFAQAFVTLVTAALYAQLARLIMPGAFDVVMQPYAEIE